jgi:hypothetical protein
MRNARKQRRYNLILTTVAFLTIMVAIVIAVSLNKRQQTFYSEAQSFANHVALYTGQEAVTPAGIIHILVYAEKPTSQDWIGLFSLQTEEQVAMSKQYLKDCALRSEGVAQVGFCDFAVPDSPGLYVIRLYRENIFMTATSPIRIVATVSAHDTQTQTLCTPQPPCFHQTPTCSIPTPSNGWCPTAN